jgi:hypothetical protein
LASAATKLDTSSAQLPDIFVRHVDWPGLEPDADTTTCDATLIDKQMEGRRDEASGRQLKCQIQVKAKFVTHRNMRISARHELGKVPAAESLQD